MLLKQRSYDLTEGPVRKMLVLFVLPIIAGSLFQQLYTTADAAIVGRFAGKQALAAIDAVYNLIRLPTVFLRAWLRRRQYSYRSTMGQRKAKHWLKRPIRRCCSVSLRDCC